VRRALLTAHLGRPGINGDQAADQVQQQRQQFGVRPRLQPGRAGGAQQVISSRTRNWASHSRSPATPCCGTAWEQPDPRWTPLLTAIAETLGRLTAYGAGRAPHRRSVLRQIQARLDAEEYRLVRRAETEME
jgi:hypothetical protein